MDDSEKMKRKKKKKEKRKTQDWVLRRFMINYWGK